MAEEKIVIVPERPYANHGNTVAAWVMVAIMTVWCSGGFHCLRLGQSTGGFRRRGYYCDWPVGWVFPEAGWLWPGRGEDEEHRTPLGLAGRGVPRMCGAPFLYLPRRAPLRASELKE